MNELLERFAFLNNNQLEQMSKFAEILLEENEKYNLTAIKDADGIRLRHFCDSLMGVELLEGVENVIDIGSGAGFPGLVLAIAKPEVSVVSVEATGKKVCFQQKIIDELGLLNAEVLSGRAEILGRDVKYRQKFDVAAGRAVADMSILAELELPFVRVGGKMLAWKSLKSEQEILRAEKAIEKLGGKIAGGKDYSLSGEEKLRIVVIEKVGETPSCFPREFKVIKQKPLG